MSEPRQPADEVERTPEEAPPRPSARPPARPATPPSGVDVTQPPPTSSWLPADDQQVSTDPTDFPFDDEPPVVRELTPEEREARRERRELRRARRARAARRRRVRRVLIAVAATLLVLVVWLYTWAHYAFGGLERIPDATTSTPDTPGTTVLLVGSDPAARDQVVQGEGWRTGMSQGDLVMLLHIPADGSTLYAVSLPHDARVDVPGVGEATLSKAYDTGKQQLFLRTVESLTGAHVDHLAVLDFNALREIADKEGGVNVRVTTAMCGDQVGTRRLDGESLVQFMRLQDCMPRGDLDRIARQQEVFKGLLAAVLDGGSLANPFHATGLAHSTSAHLAVEDGWSLWQMARLGWSMRNIGPARTLFLTAPTLPRATKSRPLRFDPSAAGDLWSALRTDRMAEYVQLHRGTTG